MNIAATRPPNEQGIRARRACVHAGRVILELLPEVQWAPETSFASDLQTSIQRMLKAFAGQNEPLEHIYKPGIAVQNTMDDEKYVVWACKRKQITPTRDYVSPAELETKYLHGWENKYDIFIKRRTVLLSTNNRGPIKLDFEERHYRLLVMLLIRKDDPLPAVPLYQKAWTSMSRGAVSNDKDAVEFFLKPAISEIRTKMLPIYNFSIPRKKPDVGYFCEGDFSFCVIIPSQMENEFRLRLV